MCCHCPNSVEEDHKGIFIEAAIDKWHTTKFNIFLGLIMVDEAKERRCQFKKDLNVLQPIEIAKKHIISGECCYLSEREYRNLRSEVADYFGLCSSEVLVVGSAKLGFSVAPDKRYCLFHDESDIDVVLVSSKLFDKIWEDVFSYKQEGGYWPKYSEFADYLFQGWIRPDKLPRSPIFPFGKKWWKFFQDITRSQRYGDYKIVGALYRSYFFLESYQEHCVKQCINEKSINNLEKDNARITR